MGEMDGERLMRLEESLLFADRRLDELHEQVLLLLGRVEALTARVAGVERAFGEATERGEDSEPNAEAGGGPEGPP